MASALVSGLFHEVLGAPSCIRLQKRLCGSYPRVCVDMFVSCGCEVAICFVTSADSRAAVRGVNEEY